MTTKKKSKPKKALCPETGKLDLLTSIQRYMLLVDLMTKLDDLDSDDFFGTEGWRKYLGYED